MRVVVVLPSRVGNWQVSSSSSSPSSSSLSSSSPSSPSPSTPSHCFLNSNFIFHSHSHFSTKAGPPTCPPISNFNPACSAHSWRSRFEYTPQLPPRTLALLHFSLHRQALVHQWHLGLLFKFFSHLNNFIRIWLSLILIPWSERKQNGLERRRWIKWSLYWVWEKNRYLFGACFAVPKPCGPSCGRYMEGSTTRPASFWCPSWREI